MQIGPHMGPIKSPIWTNIGLYLSPYRALYRPHLDSIQGLIWAPYRALYKSHVGSHMGSM